MANKKTIKLVLSSFIALGVMVFSHISNNSINEMHADELIGTPSVSWDNIDYAGFGPHEVGGIPQEGYCVLVQYPSDISSTLYTTQSLLTMDVPGCNVKDHILINGVESQNVEDTIIYCYPYNGLYIYIPHNSITFTDEYENVTIDVLEGMSIDGSVQTVASTFEFRGLIRSMGGWLVNPAPIEKIQGEFTRIDWNNQDYSYTLKEEWCGELNSNISPKEGYCLLAFFNEKGKSYSESEIGNPNLPKTGRGVIGMGYNIDTKVKVNGVNIVDVEGVICFIFPKYGLFFYLPDATLPNKDTYSHPIITMEKGVHFNNVYLPMISFEFRGEIGNTRCWTYVKDPSEYNKFEFNGIAGEWNNVYPDANHTQTILIFGEYGKDYLKADGISDSMNLVNKYSDCGLKITVNGVPLWEIGDTEVSYIHGYCYVYIALPVSCLTPSNGYKITTLHIEENTIFYETFLNEVYLYLFNGKWILEKPETPDDSDFDNVLSFSSLFDSEKATLDENNKQLSASKDLSLESFGLFIDYKLLNSNSDFALYVLGNGSQNGLRVVFRNNTLSLYDSTQENVLLGNATIEQFNYDEWYSLFVFTRVNENSLSIYVAVDDVIYIHVDEVELANEDNIGNNVSIYLGSGVVSFKNATLGADNKKPVLSYYGKSVYSVLVGSDALDFTGRCSAFDSVDGNVTDSIIFTWPEGALTSDNKINKGEWEVSIIASDKSNNTSELSVIVIAVDKLEVTVTFDGENPVIYKVGDHIAPIVEPVKEGDGATSYRFIGWYYNDRLWDFENDYVITDMNLVSKYQETAEEFMVVFSVEGLDDVSSYTLYFAHGTKLNLHIFDKEGYSLKAFVDDEEVESITIDQNMNVRLVYTSDNPSVPSNNGCGGSIISTSLILSFISGMAFILLVIQRKKGGKYE